jgi:NADPH:quinone reductase-like Zn-dependent oxidoreductase
MHASVNLKHGKPDDVLQAVDVHDPNHPEPNEVLIRVLLGSVGNGDLLGWR